MKSAADHSGGATWPVFAAAIVLGGVAASWALRAEGNDAESPLSVATSLQIRPLVQVVGFDEAAATYAVQRWVESGIEVAFGSDGSFGSRIVAVSSAEEAEAQSVTQALERAGFEVAPERWTLRPDIAVRPSDVVVALTLPAGTIAETRLYSPAGGTDRLVEALERLSRSAPPTRPQIVIWRDGVRTFEMRLDAEGRATSRRRVFPVDSLAPPVERPLFPNERELVEAAVQGSGLALATTAPTLAAHKSLEVWTWDGPAHRAGRFDPIDGELEIALGVPGALEDAVRDFVEWSAFDQNGPAATLASDTFDEPRDESEANDRALPPNGEAIFVRGTPELARQRLGAVFAHETIESFARMGFESVCLEVHVPLAPPLEEERATPPLSMRGWGRGATLEGDASVRAAISRARASGMSVVLWPRFVASASGPEGNHQNHGDGAGYERFGRRWALATERIARLAELAGADGLVLFGPADMPLARKLVSDVASDERRAGYDALLESRARVRREVVEAAEPFRGTLLGHVRGLPAIERTSVEAQTLDDSVFGENAARPVGVIAGLPSSERSTVASIRGAADALIAGAAGLRIDAISIELASERATKAAATALGEGQLPLAIVSRWPVGDGVGGRFERSRASEETLEALGGVSR